MLTRNDRTATKRRNPGKSPSEKKPAAVGTLPEWDLSDLYPGVDSDEIKRDLARSDARCLAFEEQYKGKLDGLAKGSNGGQALAAAIREFEAIDDLLGRITSFAVLVYTGNTTDPVRSK